MMAYHASWRFQSQVAAGIKARKPNLEELPRIWVFKIKSICERPQKSVYELLSNSSVCMGKIGRNPNAMKNTAYKHGSGQYKFESLGEAAPYPGSVSTLISRHC